MVVTAGYGLGDVIVSGEVTPDVFYVDKATLKLRRRVLGSKPTEAVGARPSDGGCLDDAQLQEVGELGRRVEAHYGQPQDLEWAWAGGRLYLLQARPITGRRSGAAVSPEVRRASVRPGRRAPRGLNRWYREFLVRNLADHFPDPLRPLDFTTMIRAMFVGVREVLAEVGVDTGAPERFFPPSQDGEIVFSPPLPRPTLSLLTLLFRLPRRSAVDVRRVWVEIDTPYVESRLEALRRLDPGALTGGELATAVTAAQDLLDEICRRRFRHFVPGVVHAILFKILTRLGAGSGAVQARTALLGGIDHRTAKLNAELARLARDAADRPRLRRLFREAAPEALEAELEREPEAASFRARLKGLLAEFGARGARGMLPMPSFPSWADRPVVVLGLLQAMVREAPAVGQPSSDEDELRARTARQDQLRVRLGRSWRGWLRLERRFDASVDRYRGLLYLREESLWQGEILVAALRPVVLEIGRRLRLGGTIADEEDVFFLRREEIAGALSGTSSATRLPPLISARRTQFLAWEKGAREGHNWVGLALGLEPYDLPASAAREVLSGLPASPGMAKGPVKLVRDQAEFHRLERGDVLVCPVTTPAWTPLFSLAAAVVTDIGGPLSHAANVAREQGIPAVLGTNVATRVLHDGETVLVDGTAGRVSRATS
jgi:rifampicin phosphotransferase